MSQPILEEEEHHVEEETINKKLLEKNNSEPSLPGTPVMEANGLQSDGAMFREVAVTGGE